MVASRQPSKESTSTSFLNQTIYNDIIAYSKTHPIFLSQLYTSPPIAHSIFRALPPIARLYLTRLLLLPPSNISTSRPTFARFKGTLRKKQRAAARHDHAVACLRELHLVEEDANGGVVIEKGFGECLRKVLAGDWEDVFGESGEKLEGDVLEKYSRRKWERVLNFLVGGDEDEGDVVEDDGDVEMEVEENGNGGRRRRRKNGLSPEIVVGLTRIGLLENTENGLTISSLGFQFLLKDQYDQIWIFLRHLVQSITDVNEKISVIDFLFRLSFTKMDTGYNVGDIDQSVISSGYLEQFSNLGILLRKGNMFYVTSLGRNLVQASSRIYTNLAQDKVNETEGVLMKTTGDIKIIVETNFHIYAYTQSTFQLNLLNLFCHLVYRLPHMIVGYITRDTIRQAVLNGINSDQIIGYLNAHIYSEKGCKQIPNNVSDEIRIWEAEESRLQMNDGVFLNEFDNEQMFQRVLKFVMEIDACLWQDSIRRQIVVREAFYGNVKRFIKDNGSTSTRGRN